MEGQGRVSTVEGLKGSRARDIKNRLYRVIEFGLKLSGLHSRGHRNALDIQVRDIDIHLPTLPRELDGYRIMHLTDLHLDAIEGLDRTLSKALRGVEADLCVLTGDYREADTGPCDDFIPLIRRAIAPIQCPDGIFAVLGNHDTHEMVPHLEVLGVRVLANESSVVSSRGTRLVISGIDDVHNYYTAAAPAALADAPAGFKVALVHSPELAGVAAENGFGLYLCGHTHGGQVCLPGGRPIVTHLYQHRDLASGLWEHRGMRGYTSPGIGTSCIPVRFFTRPEITRITLRATQAGNGS